MIRAAVFDDEGEFLSYTESVWASAPGSGLDSVPGTGVNETASAVFAAIGVLAGLALLAVKKKEEEMSI